MSDISVDTNNSVSFKYKHKTTGKTGNGGTKIV